MPSRILIAGGGLAAQRAAETLRARGHDGAIQVICAEPVAPYDRPPLSKELAATPFRPAGWYADNDVELLLGRRARSTSAPGGWCSTRGPRRTTRWSSPPEAGRGGCPP